MMKDGSCSRARPRDTDSAEPDHHDERCRTAHQVIDRHDAGVPKWMKSEKRCEQAVEKNDESESAQ
jgi:hypothetical protein